MLLWTVRKTHARNGWFARLVETIRSGMAGSGTFGPSSLKLGSGLPSMFEIQDIFSFLLLAVSVTVSVRATVRTSSIHDE
jgi:hypothetical protein